MDKAFILIIAILCILTFVLLIITAPLYLYYYVGHLCGIICAICYFILCLFGAIIFLNLD